jgi:hypothetical protein
VDLVSRALIELIGQPIVGAVSRRYAVRPPRDTTDIPRGRTVQQLPPRRQEIVVHRESIERMHKVDRRVPLLWKPLQEASFEQALQRGGRLGHFGHPADHCKRGALTEHRKRRRELIRILGQLGQRPHRRGGQRPRGWEIMRARRELLRRQFVKQRLDVERMPAGATVRPGRP